MPSISISGSKLETDLEIFLILFFSWFSVSLSFRNTTKPMPSEKRCISPKHFDNAVPPLKTVPCQFPF